MPDNVVEIDGRPLKLDARPDRLDLRDLPYRPAVRPLPPRFPDEAGFAATLRGFVAAGLILDQGEDGACTGFGLAAVINYLLWQRSGREEAARVSTRMLYHLARFYDEWPGEAYEGSSCRGALKGWHKHGACTDTLWPYDPKRFMAPDPGWEFDAVTRPLGVYYRIDRASVVDMQAAIVETGAIFVSSSVHSGWDVPERKRFPLRHDQLPRIRPKKRGDGGHAFALIGFDEHGFVVQNSWGEGWGARGFAVLPYGQWVEHGDDAWVVALGAPIAHAVSGKSRGEPLAAPKHRVPGRARVLQAGGLPGWLGRNDPLADRPHAWREDTAYRHALVTGNDGVIVNHLPDVENAAAAAASVARDRPQSWLEGQARGSRRLVVYAHGGLTSREQSMERIRVLGPWFVENGIYPVFITWQTGWLETLRFELDDRVRDLLGALPERGLPEVLTEPVDRLIEVFCRTQPVRALWSQMKDNAAVSTEAGRGLAVLVDHLAALHQALDGDLDVHFVAHSAGSYIAGRVLAALAQRGVASATCTLFAPACDLRFALDHFAATIEGGALARSSFTVHALSDARERDDAVFTYRKSLLYLVSRALDARERTPLAGLASAYDGDRATEGWWNAADLADVVAWQQWFWGGAVPAGFADQGPAPAVRGLNLVNARSIDTGPRNVPATHGSFDNNLRVFVATLRAILGLAADAPLPAPPNDIDD